MRAQGVFMPTEIPPHPIMCLFQKGKPMAFGGGGAVGLIRWAKAFVIVCKPEDGNLLKILITNNVLPLAFTCWGIDWFFG